MSMSIGGAYMKRRQFLKWIISDKPIYLLPANSDPPILAIQLLMHWFEKQVQSISKHSAFFVFIHQPLPPIGQDGEHID